MLRAVDETLPEQIGGILKEEDPKDIYAAIVSSQFDADRIDYIQRDRMAAGVEFGHIDRDWLFDCLDVGSVTVGDDDPYKAPCLYLGPKGLSVAEEYLEARFRLYQMVYMHKTTRSAEKMLEGLLGAVASGQKDDRPVPSEPVSRYLTCDTPALGAYLDLDDAAVWSALTVFSDHRSPRISALARRLRDRKLYKCIDVGVRNSSGGNLFRRFQRELTDRAIQWVDELFFDESTMTSYKWYDFGETSALNKVLVKTRSDMEEPADIVEESRIAGMLRREEHIYRVYAPDSDRANELQKTLGGMRT